jgi:hypothetical protein
MVYWRFCIEGYKTGFSLRAFVVVIPCWFLILVTAHFLIPNVFVLFQKNWNLFSVNVAMAGTGLYQLSRKMRFVRKPSMSPHTYTLDTW